MWHWAFWQKPLWARSSSAAAWATPATASGFSSSGVCSNLVLTRFDPSGLLDRRIGFSGRTPIHRVMYSRLLITSKHVSVLRAAKKRPANSVLHTAAQSHERRGKRGFGVANT